MMSENTHYRVYLAGYMSQQDTQNHAIWVDTTIIKEQRWGWLFHVKGNLLHGMTFEEKFAIFPLLSATGETIQ